MLMWTEARDVSAMQEALSEIIGAYERDFAKHPNISEFPKISMIWKSIPSQLARENKKFIYKVVKEGARAREYEDALQWLVDARLVHKIYRSTAPGLPVAAYDDLSAFKIYLVDVGLLRRLAQLAPTAFGEGNRLFTEFKGALTENFVLQTLITQFEVVPRYWSQNNPPYEVDFLIQRENDIFPVEVKSEANTTSKNLKKFKKLFPDQVKLRVRFSLDNLKLDDDVLNIPLFIETLKTGHSFRVEAGAGSGKTYSLNRVIEWIQANKWSDYSRKKQNVVCITYTNAAVDVIAERLAKDSFILPSTIHSFAWNAIKQYQSVLIDAVTTNPDFLPDEGDFNKVTEVAYTLGHRYKENGIQYLYHDDVLKLFCLLLDNAKFRRVFADKYPLILIDEYQDSYKPIIDRFVDYFIAKGIGPQFGFFGDAWQTIYQSNKACGAIEHDNIDVIKKSSNFRSSPRIVQLLNDIRPDLPQKSAIDDFKGEVFVITCEDYTGPRRADRNFKNELPPEELKSRLNKVTEKIKQETPADEELKVLMITHKVLATQQGYEKLLDILNDGLRDKEDPFLLFFMETVEPIYHALNTSDMQLLFDTLGIKRYPITKKAEKNKWKELQRQLDEARKKRAIDVFEIINRTKLIPIPPKLDGWYHLYQNTPETIYASNTSIEAFLNLDYAQFIAVKDFLHPEAQYSTEHGVKGEEYDNVIFVISKGWNQYQFETYAPMITKKAVIPSGKQASFERNRNLFYVCCSRPKKRLIFFVTVPIDSTFKSFLIELVGEQNIFTFSQYIERKSIK